MKRNTKFTILVSALSLTTLLVACGGGGSTEFISTGGDTAGIGGSGFVSSGTITGFGSVFVNGVKFETTNAYIDIEGTKGREEQLAIGMVVQVNGTINSDGVTGTATSIIFDDDLQGPVSGYPTETVNLTVAKFTVLGIDVQIDRKTTYFDGEINFDNIRNGNMVELSGFFDSTGTLIASRIEHKTGDENVELKGSITEFTGSTFKLQGINVDASRARLEDLPNGLANGIRIEVKGGYTPTTNTISATQIESAEIDYNDRNEIEIEGYITDFISNANFKIRGYTIDASQAELEPRSLQIANNLQVEVEGRLVNGVLIAEEIKMRGGDVEVSAYISNINLTNNSFEVTPVTGENSIIIQTGMETLFENDVNKTHSFPLSDLNQGDFVEVEGYLNDGMVFGSNVKVDDPDDIEVQGIIEDFSISTITMFGIPFETTSSTEFEGDNGINDLGELRAHVQSGDQILVKLELDNNTGVITKVEIED